MIGSPLRNAQDVSCCECVGLRGRRIHGADVVRGRSLGATRSAALTMAVVIALAAPAAAAPVGRAAHAIAAGRRPG